ncbi:hypothetical protein DOY81_013836, partial [Sarcophaga bullata]
MLFITYACMCIDISECREKPLALYVMSNSDKTIKLFMTQTSSGGFCSNDLLNHFT